MQNPHPGFFTTNTVTVPTLPAFAFQLPPYDPSVLTRFDTYSPETDNSINKNDKIYIIVMSKQNVDWVHDVMLEQIKKETGVALKEQSKVELARVIYQTYQQYYLTSYFLGNSVMEIVQKLNTLATLHAVKIIVKNIKSTAWYLKYEKADYNPVPDLDKPILPSLKGENALIRKFD